MHYLALLLACPILLVAALVWSTAGPKEPEEFQVEGRDVKMFIASGLLLFALLLIAHFVREQVSMLAEGPGAVISPDAR